MLFKNFQRVLHFFDNRVVNVAREGSPSPRGEKEITSLLSEYLRTSELNVSILPRGTAWLDTGTVETLHDAASYIRLIEERQGSKIACIEEIVWRQGWISDSELVNLAKTYAPSPYAEYLLSLISESVNKEW